MNRVKSPAFLSVDKGSRAYGKTADGCRNPAVRYFQNMQKKKQLSVILISHQERIMQLADTIMIIENGRVKHQGAKESVLPELMQEFDCRCCKE